MKAPFFAFLLFCSLPAFSQLVQTPTREQIDSLYKVSEYVFEGTVMQVYGCTNQHDLGTCYSYCDVTPGDFYKGNDLAFLGETVSIQYITWNYGGIYDSFDLEFEKGAKYLFFVNENKTALGAEKPSFVLVLERSSAFPSSRDLIDWLTEMK